MNWLKLGDKNTSFFHKYASQRRRTNTVNRLEYEDGRMTKDPSDMGELRGASLKNFLHRKVGRKIWVIHCQGSKDVFRRKQSLIL